MVVMRELKIISLCTFTCPHCNLLSKIWILTPLMQKIVLLQSASADVTTCAVRNPLHVTENLFLKIFLHQTTYICCLLFS